MDQAKRLHQPSTPGQGSNADAKTQQCCLPCKENQIDASVTPTNKCVLKQYKCQIDESTQNCRSCQEISLKCAWPSTVDAPQKAYRSASSGDEEEALRGKRSKIIDQPKYACPYFQRNPWKHRLSRTCSGAGWAEIHRLK